MRNGEDLVVRLVLRREKASVLEVLQAHVDSVELVLLSAGEIEDHHRLEVISMGDVGNLSMGENDGSLVDDQVVAKEGLAGSSHSVPDPVNVAGVGIEGDDVVDVALLPRPKRCSSHFSLKRK